MYHILKLLVLLAINYCYLLFLRINGGKTIGILKIWNEIVIFHKVKTAGPIIDSVYNRYVTILSQKQNIGFVVTIKC